MEHLSPWDLK